MKKNRKKKQKRQSRISYGHRQVAKIIGDIDLKVINEYKVNNLPYDIYVEEKNLIIEYYGDRWHYPKHIYPSDFWDKVKNRYVWEKWERDGKKIQVAKDKGYNIEIIWENEWKKIKHKKRFIEKMMRKYNK